MCAYPEAYPMCGCHIQKQVTTFQLRLVHKHLTYVAYTNQFQKYIRNIY